jgi:hydroxyquinol 1,2-dioxygenase
VTTEDVAYGQGHTGPATPADREQAITDQVVASFATPVSERYGAVMASLVRHLHAFVRDVRLTEAEWSQAIDFLTRTGQASDERRHEFVLLSDVLGISMMTVTVNEVPDPEVTESTVFGPFFVAGSPAVPHGGDLSGGAVGQPCWVQGRVRGQGREPVAGARVEVWEADGDGCYDVQYDDHRTANRGHLFTDADGRFSFWSIKPVAYPIPTDGPVGELLRAGGRGSMRPAHVHFMITSAGYRPLTTHIFVAGDEYLNDDAVFGVKDSLVAEFVQHAAGELAPPGAPGAPGATAAAGAPGATGGTGTPGETAWSSLSYEFVLASRPQG